MPRLDVYLAASGRAASRTLAAKLVEGGYVKVNGRTVLRPAFPVEETDQVEAAADNPLERYVSRGGLKLERALEEFGVDPAGLVCVDIGASTGGFTDCLLQHGAARVYAVDSGSDQLHPSLRSDPRVCSMERRNARDLSAADLGEKADLAVMDVSFISQSCLYGAVCRVLKPEGVLISLIKPQFEAGPGALNKNGVVTDEAVRRRVTETLSEKAAGHGLVMRRTAPSPIPGGDGNRETLALFERKHT